MPAPERDPEFEALFDATYTRMVGLGRRLLGTTAAGENLAADSPAEAFLRWRSVRRQPSPEGWVLCLATDRALEQLGRDDKPMLSRAAGHHAEEAAAARRSVVEVLRRLPRQEQRVVAMRYLGGLPEQDVADALAISAGTVSSTLTRGLTELRNRLDEPALAALERGLDP